MRDAKKIAIDVETSEHKPDGSTVASTEAYRHDFRVDSMAVTWREGERLVSKFIQGEPAIRTALEDAVRYNLQIISHNAQFEMLVVFCRFPDLYDKLNWHADTMRLVQNYDNGGDENSFETIILDDDLLDIEDPAELLQRMEGGVLRESVSGLGLVKSLKRIFKEDYKDHKKEAYTWLRNNGVRAGKEGANLHLLPVDILERYNIADTENTYLLYEHCTKTFADIGYDWTLDHTLFFSSVRLIVAAKVEGIQVKRDELAQYIEKTRQEIENIGTEFVNAHRKYIDLIEEDRRVAWISQPKTDKGKAKRQAACVPGSDVWEKNVRFNPGSNKQLEVLFKDKMGIRPKFFTEKGSPSFKSSVLSQWGQGGLMLQKRRKRLIVLKQSESLYALSEYDGKFRPDIRAAGTATGRYVGSK